jgi:hypothetical protein
MRRHSRPLSGVCPIVSVLVLLGVLSLVSAFAATALTPVQQLAAARGAEALDAAGIVSTALFKAFDPDALSLLVVQPAKWAVLLNHPQPPAAFRRAEPLGRRKLEEEGTQPVPWSVHLTNATSPYEELPHPWVMLEERPTAVVFLNDVSVATGNAAGWPPSEAVLIHMVRALWQTHRAVVEPGRGLDEMPWRYHASAEDLALAVIEQRLLLAANRLVYNEHTQDDYRKLLKTWLAVRKLRLKNNPAAMSMEETMEHRQGMADFVQTAPFRLAEKPGAEDRPQLEGIDPLFVRYRNFVNLRINILNYPLNWSPMDPVECLLQARARGVMLAYVAWPVLPMWSETYFPPGGGNPRPWRELLEPALYKDAPADPITEAQLIDEARTNERHDLLVRLIRSAMEEKASGNPNTAAHGNLPELRLSLAGRPLLAWEASPKWSWLSPGRVAVAGPLRLKFEGGEVRLGGGSRAIFSAAGESSELAEVRLLPPAGSALTVGKRTLPWGTGRKTLSLQGDGSLMAPGMEVSFRGASVHLGPAEGILSWSAVK